MSTEWPEDLKKLVENLRDEAREYRRQSKYWKDRAKTAEREVQDLRLAVKAWVNNPSHRDCKACAATEAAMDRE